MGSTCAITRKRIEAQGYLGLSDEELSEVGPWLSFAPAICMIWAATATYFQSTLALAILIPFAAVGALMKGHPFEVLYNHGIRHLTGTQHLPPARAPRRFACGVATIWLIAASGAFYSGAVLTG